MTLRLPLAGCLLLSSLIAGACSGDDDTRTGLPTSDEGGVDAATAPPPDSGGAEPRGPDASLSNTGNACTSDAACGAGLECVDPDTPAFPTISGPGYIAGGYCAAPCDIDVASDEQCPTGTRCVAPNNQPSSAYCFAQCVPGGARPEEGCGDRTDLGCEVIGPTIRDGACVATCGGDSDCGDRFCDLGSGHCVDVRPTGSAIGAPCNADDDCASNLCLDVAGASFCSGLCVLDTVGCGYDPSSTEPPDAMCAYVSDPFLTAGDRGFCGQLCDCDDDCLHPDAVCDPLPAGSPSAATARGRLGICTPRAAFLNPDQAGIPCGGPPDAGVDAALPVVDSGTGASDASPLDAATTTDATADGTAGDASDGG